MKINLSLMPSLHRIKKYVSQHRLISTVIVCIVIIGAYALYSFIQARQIAPRYMVSKVHSATVTTTVSGSGQVSASNQIDIKSKVSGDIVELPATVGQHVALGDVIARIDATDASINLKSARIALAKLTQPADIVTLTQTQNNLTRAYDDGFNAVATTFSDFPDIINGVNDMFYTSSGYLNNQKILSLSDQSISYKTTAGILFDKVKNAYDATMLTYHTTPRTSTPQQLENLINETYTTAQQAAEALKNTKNAVEKINNEMNTQSQTQNQASVAQANLVSWIAKINNDISSLLSAKNSIAEYKASLEKLNSGADPLDIESAQLNVEQKKEIYDSYTIRAPFDGVIAKISIKPSDSINSGGTVATLITSQKTAIITLNEVDVAKIKTGDDALLTFDAIDGLSIHGKVSSIDLVGTVAQGVVSYNVTISFDTQDDRIKSGMSVTASIVTATKENVLVVPTSAIKNQGNKTIVDILDGATTNTRGVITTTQSPTSVTIHTGLSDDTNTEIIDGLNEGQLVVVKKIDTTTAPKTTSAPSLFGNNLGGRTNGYNTRTGGTTNSK